MMGQMKPALEGKKATEGALFDFRIHDIEGHICATVLEVVEVEEEREKV